MLNKKQFLAVFMPLLLTHATPSYAAKVNLTLKVIGEGRVIDLSGTVNCKSNQTCQYSINSNKLYAMYPLAYRGKKFKSWSSPCSGKLICKMKSSASTQVTVNFTGVTPVVSAPSPIAPTPVITTPAPVVTAPLQPVISKSITPITKAPIIKTPIVKTPATNQAGTINLCQNLVADKNPRSVRSLAKPGYLRSVTDPAFGTKITRITNASGSEVVKPVYSSIQAWNADETKLILYRKGSGHELYDGNSYQFIRKLSIRPADIEEIFWHTTNPDVFYYANAYQRKLYEYNVASHTEKVFDEFTNLCTANQGIHSGSDVQMMSWDNDLISFRCGTQRGQSTRHFTYRLSTKQVESQKYFSSQEQYFAANPLPSGQGFYQNGWFLDTLMNKVTKLDLAKGFEHSSTGKFMNGHSGYFAVAFAKSPRGCNGDRYQGYGSIVAHDANDGSCRVLVGQSNGYRYPASGTHVSAISHKNPGWVLGSSVGTSSQKPIYGRTTSMPVLTQELYIASTDEDSPQVCRLAHHRSHARGGRHGYWGEPHASLSPTGTRVIFASDWHNTGGVDTYVVELPAHQ